MTGIRRLITVHSQKGGVGKTLISLFLANGLACRPPEMSSRRTVLIDADMTGTSIADAIPLLESDGQGGFRSRTPASLPEENRSEQGSADSSEEDDPINIKSSQEGQAPVLNDFIFYDPWGYPALLAGARNSTDKRTGVPQSGDWNLTDLLRCWDISHVLGLADSEQLTTQWRNDPLRVIPSSSARKDIMDAVPDIYKENLTGYFEGRLTDLIQALWIDRETPVVNVVVDTPPGLHGISEAALRLHDSVVQDLDTTARGIEIVSAAVFVVTIDAQDVLALVKNLAPLIEPSAEVTSAAPSGASRTCLKPQKAYIVFNRVPKDYEERAAEQAKRTLSLADDSQVRHIGQQLLGTEEHRFFLPYDERMASFFVDPGSQFYGASQGLEKLLQALMNPAPSASHEVPNQP